MTIATPGLHHITAIASETATNMAFYTGVLGLRLVKRTVNFDDQVSYHLYYGDATGHPGTLLTFFVGFRPTQISPDSGRVTCVRFVVPPGSLDYWIDRLSHHGVRCVESEAGSGPGEQTALSFADPDGLPLQLVTTAAAVAAMPVGSVAVEHAIRGLHGVELSVVDPVPSARFLVERLGFALSQSWGEVQRLVAAGPGVARFVDLRAASCLSGEVLAAGRVHHVAFRARDGAEQLAWRDHSRAAGIEVTPVKDRKDFRSIYFQEPSGVRFEIATDGPGFTIDESADSLGRHLQLPEALEPNRTVLEAGLKAV